MKAEFPFLFNDMLPFKSLKSLSVMNFENKDILHKYHMMSMLNKCSNMFDYKGIPDTITQRNINILTAYLGYAIVFKYNNNLYVSFGGLGGELNEEYMPTKAIIANPYLKLSETFTIDKDCVVIPNDNLYMGLTPINNYYATQLVENDMSLNCNLINGRMLKLLYSDNADDKKALDEVIKDLKNGKISSALGKISLGRGIDTLDFGVGSHNNIVQLLEHRQYIKGSWWNEIGVQSNYNMKRETITSSENILNVDSLLPFSDVMLETRKIAVEKINKMFDCNWSVDWSSAWKKVRKEIQLKEKQIEKDLSNQLDNSNVVDNNDNGVDKNENNGE